MSPVEREITVEQLRELHRLTAEAHAEAERCVIAAADQAHRVQLLLTRCEQALAAMGAAPDPEVRP